MENVKNVETWEEKEKALDERLKQYRLKFEERRRQGLTEEQERQVRRIKREPYVF